MKANPKKMVWRREQGYQPEGKDYKVRDETVTVSSWTKEETERRFNNGAQIWEQGWFGPTTHDPHPIRREGDKLCIWHMSRTAWDSVIAWIWKKDLIDEYLNDLHQNV